MTALPAMRLAPISPARLADFATLLLLLLGLTACREQKSAGLRPDNPFDGADATNLVARVAGQLITRAALDQVLARRGPGTDKAKVLDELVTFEATYAKAKTAGFDQTPEVSDAIKRLIVSKYRETQIKDDTARVTDQEIAQYYQDHLREYATLERARVALIFLHVPSAATPEKQAEHLARAEAILVEARQLPPGSPTFGPLAAKYSEDQASRYQGGDIGWVAKDQSGSPWGQPLLEALLALRHPGELTPVLRTERGLVIARLMERQPAGTRPLSEMKDGLGYRLSRARAAEQQEQFFAAMKAGLQIDLNHPLLDALTTPAPAPEPPPPSLPGGATVQTQLNR